MESENAHKPAKKLQYKTVIMSDIHLGTPSSKANEAHHFLDSIDCERLILNGDIIDGWYLKRKDSWKDPHTRFVELVLEKIEHEHTDVIYLRGNHDDILRKFLPFTIERFRVLNEYIHETPKRKYLIVHGDGFDTVTTNARWLAVLGSICYEFLLWINRFYNKWRKFRGKEYFSLSKYVKSKVKGVVNFVGKYEEQLVILAKTNKCTGIMCGHIHTPADKMVEDIHYLNSGDWVESLTAIVEDYEGNLKVISYKEFEKLLTEV